ncbi:MAG: Gfo/Idh/MocA family protein [Christensenellales bacterium]|jgi:myo-inositol 2-dehydrogenase/D-chiro-inositol 1-dehydrogenase
MVRVGVVGTGAIGTEHIRRMSEVLSGAKVVAVTDINLEAANRVAKKYGARVENTEDTLISANDIDAIVVTSYGSAHEKTVLKVIKEGKFVFCEKPLADTAAGCKRIVEAEIAHGKRLVQVGFMRRYDKAYNLLKAKLDSGEYGKPLTVHCKHRNASMDASFTTRMSITEGFIHEIDILHWLINDVYESAQIIVPKTSTLSHPGMKDPLVMILRTKTGMYLEVEIFINSQVIYEVQTEVACENGILQMPQPLSVQTIKDGLCGNDVDTSWKYRFIEAYDAEFQAWIDSVMNGKATGPTAWDGYVAAVTSDACLKSLDSRKIESVTFGEYPDFYNDDFS